MCAFQYCVVNEDSGGLESDSGYFPGCLVTICPAYKMERLWPLPDDPHVASADTYYISTGRVPTVQLATH